MKPLRWVRFAFAVSLLLSCNSLVTAEGPVIESTTGENGLPTAIFVKNLSVADLATVKGLASDSEVWASILSLRVVTPATPAEKLPPMLGRYELCDGQLQFRPLYPLRPGVKYLAEYRAPRDIASSNSSASRRDFFVPKRSAKTTTVASVFPSADKVPENLLRFYVHFSAPMARGNIYRHIRLLDRNQKPLDLPFLEIGEELWDPTGTRLTLLIDPGRIKRGLKPREELGPVLEAGKSYTLEVLPDLLDADGVPLKIGFRKSFQVDQPRELALETSHWKAKSPRAGTRDELTIEFPFPLDRALLERNLQVENSNGIKLVGDISVGKTEQSWRFTPHQEWTDGLLHIVIDTTLEDPCGNRIGRAFEVDEVTPIEKRIVPSSARIRVPVAKL